MDSSMKMITTPKVIYPPSLPAYCEERVRRLLRWCTLDLLKQARDFKNVRGEESAIIQILAFLPPRLSFKKKVRFTWTEMHAKTMSFNYTVVHDASLVFLSPISYTCFKRFLWHLAVCHILCQFVS